MIPNINNKVIELKDMIAGKPSRIKSDNIEPNDEAKSTNEEKQKNEGPISALERKKSFRKTVSTSLTDESMKKTVGVTDPEILEKLESLTRPITREVRIQKEKTLGRVSFYN